MQMIIMMTTAMGMDYGGFGVGKKASGVLLLYYMDGPGQSGGECYISTSGTMITLLTDERIETILDDVYGNLGNRDFAAASQIFLEDVSETGSGVWSVYL